MKLLKILFALVIIVIGAALIVPFLIPMETYKKEAITRLSEMTGREIAIDGDISLRIVPDVAVTLNQVTIGNPEGFSSPHLAKANHLDIGVSLNSLLNKELVVQRFTLQQPDIYLETNKAGKNNWDIEFKAPKLPQMPKAQLISDAYAQSDEPSFSIKKLEISELAIEDGKLSYIADGKTQKLEAVSLASKAVHMNQPTEFEGRLTWNSEDFSFKTRINSLQQLLDGTPTESIIGINSKPIKVSFNGKLSQRSLRGNIDAGSPSLVKAMQWLDSPMDWNKTPLLFALKGQIYCNTSLCEVQKTDIAIDAIRLNGDLSASFAGKPSISGGLSTSLLDLTPYMAETTAFYDNWSLIAEAYAAERWDSSPMDVGALNAANIDITLDAKKIILPQLTLTDAKIAQQIRNGAGAINIIQSQLFGGSMNGAITAIPRGSYINSSANMTFTNVQLETLLMALNGEAAITGKTDLTAKLTARGNSIKGIIQTLGGSGTFSVRDGAIKGVNIGQMARNVKSAFRAEKTTEQTDFTALTGSFSVTNGVISNHDLYMKAPLLRMNAQGSIDLPAYSINYRLLPEIVETSQGQGGKDKTGIVVPVLVSGSLDNPKFAPDLQAMLRNEELMKQNVEAVKDTIKDKKAEIKEIKQDFKELKKGLKDDPASLLKDPDKLNDQFNNLLKGF